MIMGPSKDLINSLLRTTTVPLHILHGIVSSPLAKPPVLLRLPNGPTLVPPKVFRRRACIACFIIARLLNGYDDVDLEFIDRILGSLESLDIAILAFTLPTPLGVYNEVEFALFVECSLQEPVDSQAEEWFATAMKDCVVVIKTSMDLKCRWHNLLVYLSTQYSDQDLTPD